MTKKYTDKKYLNSTTIVFRWRRTVKNGKNAQKNQKEKKITVTFILDIKMLMIVNLQRKILKIILSINLNYVSVLMSDEMKVYPLEDVDQDGSAAEIVSRIFKKDDEELSGIIGTSSWDSDHE